MSLSQVLAPQLQQSLALLQAPSLELKALVEQELQQNPLLEEVAEAEISRPKKIPKKAPRPSIMPIPLNPRPTLTLIPRRKSNPMSRWTISRLSLKN